MVVADKFQIKEEKNLYHDNILDLWGNAFNFSHEKGLAEWLKNSVDAYHREGWSDKDVLILFRFTDADESNKAAIECIDFVGMSHDDIVNAFKWWGDPNAAKRGKNVAVYGGHGNGGKFYMRQMFNNSHFITYKNGLLNIFGFNDNRKYGFVPEYENKKITPIEAMKMADINIKLIPESIIKMIVDGKTGFTVVKGVAPKKIIGKRLRVDLMCERLKYHPQARKPLKFVHVSVIWNGKLHFEKLEMEDIAPLAGFEESFIVKIPTKIESNDGEWESYTDGKYKQGELILKTSSQPFGKGGLKADLNCIDFIGELGVIASYKMTEIGFLKYFPQAQYIYGECYCPILENPEDDCVQNDREKLVVNDRVRILLEWVCERIDELGAHIAEQESKDEERNNIKTTDEFNQILNKWKNQFMSRLFAEVLGGPGKGSSTGGLGDEGSGGGIKEKSESKGGLGSGGGEGGGEGNEKKKGARMPLVLLSGQEDPDHPGIQVFFSERHFSVEQRQQDVERGIYWINLDKPMAKRIISKYAVESPQWRNYLFQRYVDIIVTMVIYRVAKEEGGSLTPDRVDRELMRISSLVYDKASNDLDTFLLEKKYTPEVNKTDTSDSSSTN